MNNIPNISELKILLVNLLIFFLASSQIESFLKVFLLIASIVLTFLKCLEVYKNIKSKKDNKDGNE
jgi:hypothetical protein